MRKCLGPCGNTKPRSAFPSPTATICTRCATKPVAKKTLWRKDDLTFARRDG